MLASDTNKNGLQCSLIFVFVPEEGLEPSLLSKHDFESCASTIPPLRLVKGV